MRTGDSWNPRTPAEEVVLAVCVRSGWIHIVYDEMGDDHARKAEFDAVPDAHEDDAALRSDYGRGYPWEEILPAVTGDADVELLWSRERDGFEDPTRHQISGLVWATTDRNPDTVSSIGTPANQTPNHG